MKDMEKKAGISPYDSPTIKIQRLTAYIEFREKIDG
jgi:hypothetical protein